jgi:hypothetical protein
LEKYRGRWSRYFISKIIPGLILASDKEKIAKKHKLWYTILMEIPITIIKLISKNQFGFSEKAYLQLFDGRFDLVDLKNSILYGRLPVRISISL